MLNFLFVGGSGPILNTALKTRQWTKQINQCFITLLTNDNKDNQKEVPCRLIVRPKQHRDNKKDAKGSRTQHNKTNKNNQSLRNSLRHNIFNRYRKIFQNFSKNFHFHF